MSSTITVERRKGGKRLPDWVFTDDPDIGGYVHRTTYFTYRVFADTPTLERMTISRRRSSVLPWMVCTRAIHAVAIRMNGLRICFPWEGGG